MGLFTWYNGEVPKDMKIKQVYGILFAQDGRVLLRIENIDNKKYYSLAGGKPEAYDKDIEDTLRREVKEEVNYTISKAEFIGYQAVDEENGSEIYAQVRMVALLNEIGEVLPDPDNGLTYERLLTHPNKAIKYLNWGTSGEMMINQAVKVAKEKLNLKDFLDKDEYV